MKLTPQAHRLVDNFFVVEPASGHLAPMGGAVGSFSIRGRCLELHIGDERRTPIFSGKTELEPDGLVTRGRKMAFGSEVRLMSISGPYRLANVANPACALDGVFLPSVGDESDPPF